jgi:hypothetical protein
MNAPKKFRRIVNRIRYDVETSSLLASDCYWDGRNFERHGRNTYLYRTPHGRYFTVNLTQWQGERDTLEPVSQEEAIELFEGRLTEHVVSYAAAFPDISVEEA